jgi:non-homologous end joining protein Ku
MSTPTVSVHPSVNSNDAPVKWSLQEETTLINHLVENRSQAGDGAHFKDTVWTAIAPILEAQRTEGGVKTAKKCKEKWGRVSQGSEALTP